METKKIEVIHYVEKYIAVDGTEFDNQDECLKYEKSALGVLKGRLHKMAVKEGSEADVFAGVGSDENNAFVVIPKDESEVSAIQQILYLKAYRPENYAERVEVGKVLVVVLGYNDDYAWLIDLGSLVSDATGGKFGIAKVEEGK